MPLKSFLAAALAASSVVAHPGEKYTARQISDKIAARDLAASHARDVMAKCVTKPAYQAMRARAAGRRAAMAQVLREQRGIVEKPIVARDQAAGDKWMNTCHDETTVSHYDMHTPESAIFTSNATTGLTPETIVGPYFVEGELIRRNITEGLPGVPIHLDIQFIDVTSCQPVPDMLVDVWHSNATGYYSGVGMTNMPGVGGLNTTYLRGVQVTSKEGVVQFDSIYPGHYEGRTQHIHVLSRKGGTILPNNTYVGGTANHIGQLYFDQELSTSVETFWPYTTNKNPVTTNKMDFLTIDQATENYDPFLDYVRLSSDANDGLLMWITIGINSTANFTSMAGAAAHHYADGGVANPGGGFGGPPGGFPGGGFPTGGFPGFPMPTGTGTALPTGFPSGFPTAFPSGFPTGFPGAPGGGFPGFPQPAAPTNGARPWGPCANKKAQ